MLNYVRPIIRVLPIEDHQKKELDTIFDILPKIARGEEKVFLILFQNNHELRPGGGYIGTFGILKIKDEKVTFIDTHDTNVFDSKIETGIEPPFPMSSLLKISSWEMRDSNWSADFPTNAKKAEYFYYLEGGEENIAGVVAVSTELLPSFLEITGPIEVNGYQGEYNSKNAISKLQYQVEKGYVDQDIEEGKRKYIIKELSKKILEEAQDLNWSEKKKFAEQIEEHLNQKDVMVYFKDENLQEKIKDLSWSGEVKPAKQDYLMIVDANLASLKTDQVIGRSFEYTVDFTGERACADLKIFYEHRGRVRDWLIADYTSYLRVYVPNGSWLINPDEINDIKFGQEQEKKYFGTIIKVPLGKTKTVSFSYYLPDTINENNYRILIQKQSGVKSVKGTIKIVDSNGKISGYDVELSRDREIKK